MKIVTKIIIGLASMVLVMPLMAETTQQSSCDNSATIKVGKMGDMNLTTLDKEIDRLQNQVDKNIAAHGVQFNQKRKLQYKLNTMETAQQDLIDQEYLNGCNQLREQASLETRVRKLETIANLSVAK